MTDKKVLDEDTVAIIRTWIHNHDGTYAMTESAFRAEFATNYDFENVSNKIRRDIIDLCPSNDSLFAVLMTMLRPHHFGDVQSGESYLEHISRLEAVREITEIQQFWLHRVSLSFVLSRSTTTSYAHRSLPEVVAFSSYSEASLDALVCMNLGNTYESIAISALDKWYSKHPAYQSVKTLYPESGALRRAMRDLDHASNRCAPAVQLPSDLY